MATQYSNKPIVTDGLVYALDFGNPKGYANVTFSGSSTTVNPGSVLSNLRYDTNYVATLLTASATISPLPKIENGLLKMETSGSNGGSHIEIILGSTSITTFPFLQPNSWNGTITFVAEGKSGIIFSQLGDDYAGSLSGRLISTLTPTQYAFGSGYGPVARSYNADYTGLNHFTLRMSSGSLDFFLNGIPISASGLSVSSDTSNGSRMFRIGTRVRTGAYGGMFTGSIGTMYLYNRPLTKDEIYQNYIVMSRRYNLPENEKIEIDENAYLFLQSAGITDPIITSSIDTFVRGLKQNNLWDKMIAIYPFVGTGSAGVNLTGSQLWNLKEPSLVTYPLSFTGSWIGSTSGSAPSGSNTNISTQVAPSTYYPFYNTQSAHISILSYDTPVSSSFLMGTGMTEDLAISTLAGDYGTPAAAYSVRKVRTAYSGALMDVRRSYDNVTASIGYVESGDLDTGSLLDWTIPGRNNLPGEYEGLAAAYSLRKVSASYDGFAVKVRGDIENQTRDIGFDALGNLDTGSLLNFTATGSNNLAGSYSGLAAAYSLRRVVPGYAGDAIEVQSGSVSQSIGFDSIGNLDTSSLLTFAGSGDAFVKTWYDQSGNGCDATQITAADQPQIVSGGSVITYDGINALKFNGTSTYLGLTTTLTENVAIISVHEDGTQGASDSIHKSIFASSNNPYPTTNSLGYALSKLREGSNGASFAAASLSSVALSTITINYPKVNAKELLYGEANNGNMELFKNSSLLGTNTYTPRTIEFATSYNIGYQPNFGRFFSGSLYEVIVYNSDQSSNRTYIENNINAYYNINTTSSVSTENAFVSTWYDQSGNNRHATQTTASRQPLIVSSGSLVTSSAKPALRFNGTSTNLKTNTFSAVSQPFTTFTHVKYQNLVSFNFTITHGNEIGVIGAINSVGGHLLRAGASLYEGTLAASNTPYLYYGLFSGSNSQIAINGNTATTGNAGTNQFAQITIGSDTDDEVSTFIDGFVSEHLEYYSDQSANKALIENNINNYYNIYTGSNHGFVARWYDQSGNNRHATQTATGSQPVIVESGSMVLDNNRSALSFIGSSLNFNLQWVNAAFTIYGVVNVKSLGYRQLLGEGSGSTLYYGLGIRTSPDRFAVERHGQSATGFTSVPIVDTQYLTNYYSTGLSGALITTKFRKNNNAEETADININSTNDKSVIGRSWGGNIQELVLYKSYQIDQLQPVNYGINSYYNIYPQTSSFATSSFTIQATPTSISGAINNRLTSGIPSSGPLGLITVSRTGSNSLTIARNGAVTSFAVPASGALSTGIFLGAINNNGLALGNSPLNLSFASVGTGLTNSETQILFNNVNALYYNLGITVDPEYTAILEYALSQGYVLPSQQQQSLQNKLLTDLKRAGVWQKLDGFYMFATDGDYNYATINWKNLNTYPSRKSNNVAIAQNIGMEVQDTVSSLITPYVNTQPDSNFTTTNGCYYYYPYFYGGPINILSGNQSFLRVRNRNIGEVNINGSANASGGYSITGNRALKSVQFTAPNTMVVTNGKTQYNLTTSTAAMALYNESGVISFYGPAQYSLFAYGATLTEENSDFVDAIESYLSAISS